MEKKGKPRGRNGGRRPGAEAPLVTVACRIRPDQKEWLSAQGDAAELIRGAIDNLMEKGNNETSIAEILG